MKYIVFSLLTEFKNIHWENIFAWSCKRIFEHSERESTRSCVVWSELDSSNEELNKFCNINFSHFFSYIWNIENRKQRSYQFYVLHISLINIIVLKKSWMRIWYASIHCICWFSLVLIYGMFINDKFSEFLKTFIKAIYRKLSSNSVC